jgi:hypothetical protein
MSHLAAEVRRLAPWYHTFELPGGIVTDGYFDLRTVVGKLPLPGSLAGKRCLDAAACEGFWSFELARRASSCTGDLCGVSDRPRHGRGPGRSRIPRRRTGDA